ncbi:uncharacterized protein LOC105434915 [Cucumis sativus]|uniref:uncharacterized protein LOC105434915 n=1 Tax=Cucumis sativus TaxID=3659 RepID=UPI0012F48F82|nr:uncharacterized protein LOC105434915 [Cucumis sativus]
MNEEVKGTPCKLAIGTINNIVAIATILDDSNDGLNVKVLVDLLTGGDCSIPIPVKGKIETLNQALGNIVEWSRRLVYVIHNKEEHSTPKDVLYSLNYTNVNGTIKILYGHVVKSIKGVDMVRIPMNELIFGKNKFIYLDREDLIHYCS